MLAIGALAALVWVAVVFMRGGLIGGALAVLLAGTCFGSFFFKIPAGPLPLTADRLLLAALVGQYLLYRRWGWVEARPLGASDYILAAFLAVIVVSTLSHDFQTRGGRPLAQLVFLYAMPAVLYWVVRQSRFNEQSVRLLVGSLAVFGFYLAVTAIAESRQAWSLVFPRYIASGEYVEFYGRGRGPLLNPAGNGILMALSMCAALVGWPWLGRFGKLVVVAALPVFAWGVFSTLTRSAWLGAALGTLIVAALTTPPKWRATTMVGSAVISAILVSVGWSQFMAFKRDRDVSVEDMAESARLRPILAVVAWHMFLDHPVLGCGYGQYVDVAPDYLSDRSTDLPLEKARPFVQHNVFLSLVTETGLVGMGLFVALLATWTRSAWRMWRGKSSPIWARQLGLLFVSFLGIYGANAMFQDVALIPMINMVLFFFGGAVTGVAATLDEPTSPARLNLWVPEGELIAAP
jgi:O-antigen ligase